MASSKKQKKVASHLTFNEAAEMIGVAPTTISNYAKKYNIPKGSMIVGGRITGVVSRKAFLNFVKEKNYDRKNDQVIWDN